MSDTLKTVVNLINTFADIYESKQKCYQIILSNILFDNIRIMVIVFGSVLLNSTIFFLFGAIFNTISRSWDITPSFLHEHVPEKNLGLR